jgi:hypothetical protein
MAPRYPSCEFSLVDSALEFKPRLDLWANQTAYQTWSQQQQQQKRSKRSVRFARTEKVVEHIHPSDYTAEEKLACWFRRADYKRMRAHNEATVDKMTYRIELTQDEESSTGLETRTPRENMLCHQAIRQAIFSVLDEQDDQLRFDGCLNDDILAARFMSYTSACKERALWLGQAQAVVA